MDHHCPDLNSRPRAGDGRKKTPTQKIESKRACQVSFTKRRQGLFKKAAELSVLCDADIAVVTFSPAGKPYSFASSSVQSVLDTFLNPAAAANVAAGSDVQQQQQQQEEDEMETATTKAEKAIGEMGLEELLILQQQLEERRMTVATRAEYPSSSED